MMDRRNFLNVLSVSAVLAAIPPKIRTEQGEELISLRCQLNPSQPTIAIFAIIAEQMTS